MPFKKGEVANPRGRKGSKDKDPTPTELRRMMSRLKGATPKAVEIIIDKMETTLPDGTVVTDAKMAEKIIQIYFAALKVQEDLKKKVVDTDDKPQDNGRPKFTLEMVNPSTNNVVKIENKGN